VGVPTDCLYPRPMAKVKKPGDSSTPKGSAGGPPGKKQRSRARKGKKRSSG